MGSKNTTKCWVDRSCSCRRILFGKRVNRKRFRSQEGGLGLIKKKALEQIAAKRRKEETLEKKRADNNFMKFWRMERDDLHTKGVAARKAKKARLKQVKELIKGYALIPPELEIPIHDPETEWKATNPTWIAINNEDGDEEININVGENQPWLQKDFLPFDERDDDTWARPGDWRDRLEDGPNDDEIQRFLHQAGDDEDVEDYDAFEALYETHK